MSNLFSMSRIVSKADNSINLPTVTGMKNESNKFLI